MLGYSEILKHQLGATGAELAQGPVEEIRRAADRAATLTRQLLAFSRQQVLAPQVLDLNDALGNMETLLRRVLGGSVEMIYDFDPALAPVEADPAQFEEAVTHLARNARDAMPAGGTFTIRTANVELDESFARRHVGAQPGSYVSVSLSDTGCGMPAETVAHLFEPFFTTKDIGKGTGLGLATVFGIVKQSGGNIWVESEPGRGTTFRIYLLRLTAAAAAAAAGPETTAPGGETVLVVEDEEMVRNLVRDILELHGYTVLTAGDGEDALEIAHHHPDRIEMLVTDVVMPRIDGRELARRLMGKQPDLKVLYMSGYTGDDATLAEGLERDAMFIQKPFTSSALARRVRRLLDGRV